MRNRKVLNWAWKMGQRAVSAGQLLAITIVMAAGSIRPASAQTFTVLHVFKGSPDGQFPAASLVRDAAGNLYGTTENGGRDDDGTVFKVNPAGHERVLFSFHRTDGLLPSSNLILDEAGNLYGTTLGGPGAGAVFRVSKTGEEHILHVFQAGENSDAALPVGGVIMDDAGNLYGATVLGGLGFGALYKIDPTGQFSVLYKFQGQADGANPEGPLVRDADGNLYGSAPGRASDFLIPGTVFKLAPDGTFSVLHRFTGGLDGKGPQGGLLRDKAGNLFGSALSGGDARAGTLFEITRSGKFRRLYSFTGKKDGANPNGELVQDPQGNLYGTAERGPGELSLGTVFKLDQAHKLRVLYTFKGLRDGAVPVAGLIRDRSGNLYGTAAENLPNRLVQGGSVFKITP